VPIQFLCRVNQVFLLDAAASNSGGQSPKAQYEVYQGDARVSVKVWENNYNSAVAMGSFVLVTGTHKSYHLSLEITAKKMVIISDAVVTTNPFLQDHRGAILTVQQVAALHNLSPPTRTLEAAVKYPRATPEYFTGCFLHVSEQYGELISMCCPLCFAAQGVRVPLEWDNATESYSCVVHAVERSFARQYFSSSPL
jgi:hypothetical protein